MSQEPDADSDASPVADPDEERRHSTEEMISIVYADLRRMADAFFRREAAHRTLQPTALVNEAYLRLAGQMRSGWASRSQFLAIAARCMRRVLVDAARERGAGKRPDGVRRVTLHDEAPAGEHATSPLEVDILDLDQALERVGKVKSRYLQLIELRFFGGLELEEIATVLSVSRAMIVRDLAKARTWLTSYLRDYA